MSFYQETRCDQLARAVKGPSRQTEMHLRLHCLQSQRWQPTYSLVWVRRARQSRVGPRGGGLGVLWGRGWHPSPRGASSRWRASPTGARFGHLTHSRHVARVLRVCAPVFSDRVMHVLRMRQAAAGSRRGAYLSPPPTVKRAVRSQGISHSWTVTPPRGLQLRLRLLREARGRTSNLQGKAHLGWIRGLYLVRLRDSPSEGVRWLFHPLFR